MKNTNHKYLKIILLSILFGAAAFFSYLFAHNKDGCRSTIKKHLDVNISEPNGTKTSSAGNWLLKNEKKQKKNWPTLQKPRNNSFLSSPDSQTDHKKIGDYGKSPPDISLADVAYYDPLQNGYILKKIDVFSSKEDVVGDLLSALKILNKQNMPADYFRRLEYESAYNEINTFYADTYIWPYFSNAEAKINFFLFLFTRYAADNKNWRAYERDVSDCSQFSQRVYLLLYPGEVCMEDEKYFYFLFSDRKNREERKKLCNKIPNIFYTIVTPYLLKKDASELPPSSHAMISFTPDNNLEKVIFGEPQSGSFESIGRDIGNIIEEQLAQYPLMCRLGKISKITKDNRHEAEIKIMGSYFLPKALLTGAGYDVGDPRGDYEVEPILLETQAYGLCRLISSYIEQTLNYQQANRWDFLRSVEDISRYGKIFLLQMEAVLESSVDIIMHGLIDLDHSDLRRVRDEIKDLKDLVDNQSGLSPQIENFVTELNYLFQLKLKPFLE